MHNRYYACLTAAPGRSLGDVPAHCHCQPTDLMVVQADRAKAVVRQLTEKKLAGQDYPAELLFILQEVKSCTGCLDMATQTNG